MASSMKALLALVLLAAGARAQTAPNWTNHSRAISPNARDSHAMAYDSTHAQTVLFGGEYTTANTSFTFNDTWTWDGANWTDAMPKTSPPARKNHAMAFDSAHGQTVLFGGLSSTTASSHEYGDTWVWNGSTWTQMSPATSPPARDSHAMAFDSAHGQVVLFGGGTDQGDTWVWDGANWTQKFPVNTPPGRANGAMAYDSTHGQVVLFGGNNRGSALNDTWVWDGTDWTEELPVNSPPARFSHAMAYDSVHGQVVMFGGNGDLNDTWVWDGTNWTQESPQTSPQGRYLHAMAYDSLKDNVVLFGGLAPSLTGLSTMDVSDTWLWNGGATALADPAIVGVISASAFGGFSIVAPGSWIEIYGTNLAPDTRGWATSDFTNGDNAPTSLDGVSVSIGGQAAVVDYISPTQVNAQVPSENISPGTLPLTVTNGSATSAPINLMVNGAEPGLLAPASFNVNGTQYVVAQHADGTYVLPGPATTNSSPAQPGETIVIYGIGFGPVAPNIPAGEIVTIPNQLAGSLQIFFGTMATALPYFGLSPGLVGLYQFNVVVPPIADSDMVPLTFDLNSTPGTQVLFTAVQQ